MLIRTLENITELSLWALLFGLTFSNSISEICILMIIAIFIIKLVLSRRFSLPSTPINRLIYLFCAVVFITFLRSAYFNESARGFIRVVKFALLYFSLVDFFSGDRYRIKRTFWAFMIIALFTFMNGIFQSIYRFDILRHREVNLLDGFRRVSASFVHPNDFGAYIIIMLLLTFSFFSPALKKGKKLFLILNCVLGSYCLLKTSSRAAWLAFLIGVIVYFLYYRKNISIVMPLIVLTILLLSPHGLERIRTLFVLEQNTVWERTQLWKGTWNMVKVHPFLGFGINTFSRYFLEYKPAVYPDIRYTHNSYLQMWSEIGIFGLTAFLAIIFTILKESLKGMTKKIQKGFEGFILLGAIAGYIAFLIQSGLDTNLYSLVLITLFWVMNAYLVSLNKFLEEKR